jgi:protein transport protein SEC23
MKPAIETSGGLVVLAETFDSDQFKKSLQHPFSHNEQGHLKMNFNATVEIITMKDIKICGALGPCSSLQKKLHLQQPSKIQLGTAFFIQFITQYQHGN